MGQKHALDDRDTRRSSRETVVVRSCESAVSLGGHWSARAGDKTSRQQSLSKHLKQMRVTDRTERWGGAQAEECSQVEGPLDQHKRSTPPSARRQPIVLCLQAVDQRKGRQVLREAATVTLLRMVPGTTERSTTCARARHIPAGGGRSHRTTDKTSSSTSSAADKTTVNQMSSHQNVGAVNAKITRDCFANFRSGKNDELEVHCSFLEGLTTSRSTLGFRSKSWCIATRSGVARSSEKKD